MRKDFQMNNKINIFKNRSKLTKSTYQKTKKILHKYGYKITPYYEDDAALNLVLGGDGAFINAVHQSKFSQIPFVGINTGHLGFYQEIEPDNIEDFIRNFSNGNYHLEILSVLETKFKNKTFDSINELVIKSNKSQMIRLKVYIDGIFIESFAGDGLIISTPHGSTAYSLSAGGAILHQSLNGFQLTPISPVYSNLNNTLRAPIVLPQDATIEISISKRDFDHTVLIFDGRQEISGDFRIKTTLSKKKINKVILDKNHYWSNIKDKLM